MQKKCRVNTKSSSLLPAVRFGVTRFFYSNSEMLYTLWTCWPNWHYLLLSTQKGPPKANKKGLPRKKGRSNLGKGAQVTFS